jgi:uncharacterized protein YdeI (YjbR/CyaY-like superfamily)
MEMKDPRVDAYIGASADFARPILTQLRDIVHEACPDVEETIKWGFPHFMYDGILCSMASFKQHCVLGFWKGSLIVEGDESRSDEAMGQFGRIRSLDDLPSEDTLVAYIKRAMELNEQGIQPKRIKAPRDDFEMPDDFEAALCEQSGVLDAFEAMPPSHRREYLEWIASAKREDTRRRRIAKAVAQISDGKSLHWKYQ